MLIKDIKEKISTKEFAHCTDAILSLVLEKPRTDIKENDLISEEYAKHCEEFATDFTKSYELIYQRGKTHFMDIPLIITKDVFPPVFATEPFINEILSKFGDKKRILEIGTGSGAMAIAIAKNNKDSEIIATDISEEILKVTKQNIELNKINNVIVLKSDLFKEVTGKFDLILSNPPQQKTEALNKADKVLVPYITLFRKKYPNICINFKCTDIDGILEKIKNHEADLAVGYYLENLDESFNQIEISKNLHPIFVCNESYKELINKKVDIKEIEKYPFIISAKGATTHKFALDLFNKYNLNVKPTMEVLGTSLIEQFVKSGLGISILTEEFITEELNKKRII